MCKVKEVLHVNLVKFINCLKKVYDTQKKAKHNFLQPFENGNKAMTL